MFINIQGGREIFFSPRNSIGIASNNLIDSS